MTLQPLGDVRRNVNIPLVWRREFYEAPNDVADLPNTVAPGLLLTTSRTVTLYEPSYIRIQAKAYFIADDDATWREAVLLIYEGGGVTQRDVSAGTTYHNGAVHIYTTVVCMYDNNTIYAGATTGTPYVFGVYAYTSAANEVSVNKIKWWIDVARA